MKRETMFRGNLRLVAATIILGTAATFTGCGKSSGAGNSTGTLPGGGVGGGPIGNGACVPISSPIGFQGNNIYFDSANVIGGWIPQTQAQIGQMGVGVGGGAGPYQRQAVDGTITMNVSSPQYQQGAYPPYQGYPSGSTPIPGQYGGGYPQGVSQVANVSGTIYISQQTQADIMWRFGGGQYNGGFQQPYFPNPYQQYPQQYPQYPQQQVCVSGIAMNLGHYNTYLYGGQVFLYLNGTNHGYILPF